jgi:hypothetical protein
MTRERRLALGLGLAFLAIQAIRPERTNATHAIEQGLEGRGRVPADIRALLHRSCYDCHSQEVRWPWWSEIAPGSWLIASDVKAARHAMDFSFWKASREGVRLEGMCELASAGDMPPSRYRLLHPGTRLSKDEAARLCAWTQSPWN